MANVFWFTVVEGEAAEAYAALLRDSLSRLGHDLTVFEGPGRIYGTIRRRFEEMLSWPKDSSRRIVYLDADTLVLDDTPFLEHEGACLDTQQRHIGYDLFKPDEALRSAWCARVQSKCPDIFGSDYEYSFWNSGVICGRAGRLRRLAEAWEAWNRELRSFGEPLWDQSAMRYAAYEELAKKGIDPLPEKCNWQIWERWRTPCDDACLVHRAGGPEGAKKRLPVWTRFAERLRAGDDLSTAWSKSGND